MDRYDEQRYLVSLLAESFCRWKVSTKKADQNSDHRHCLLRVVQECFCLKLKLVLRKPTNYSVLSSVSNLLQVSNMIMLLDRSVPLLLILIFSSNRGYSLPSPLSNRTLPHLETHSEPWQAYEIEIKRIRRSILWK